MFFYFRFQFDGPRDACNPQKDMMKHCQRVQKVCGTKVDIFSETQVIANHPNQEPLQFERSSGPGKKLKTS